MTNEEAIAIIRREYLCVSRDCDIEKNCGRCDLMMPSKEPLLEAYKMAMDALEQEPSGDLISRQAVIKAVDKHTLDRSEIVLDEDITVILEEVPSVAISSAEQKTGHWIERRSRATGHIESVCSECGAEEGYPYNDYCGNCGCRMIEPQERSE